MKIFDNDNTCIVIPTETYFHLVLLENNTPGSFMEYVSLKYFAAMHDEYPYTDTGSVIFKSLEKGGFIKIQAHKILINGIHVIKAAEQKKVKQLVKKQKSFKNPKAVNALREYFKDQFIEFAKLPLSQSVVQQAGDKLDEVLEAVDLKGGKVFTMDEIKAGIIKTIKVKKLNHLNFLPADMLGWKTKKVGSVYECADQSQRKVYNLIGQLVELMVLRKCTPDKLIRVAKVYDLNEGVFKEVTMKDIIAVTEACGGVEKFNEIVTLIQENKQPWQKVLDTYHIVYEDYVKKNK